MKTFKDLEFKNHPNAFIFSKQAIISFDNDYGLSIINGEGAYCDEHTFEVAILFKDKLTYNTDITNDVLTYQSEEDINDIMIKLQNYES